MYYYQFDVDGSPVTAKFSPKTRSKSHIEKIGLFFGIRYYEVDRLKDVDYNIDIQEEYNDFVDLLRDFFRRG